MRKKSLFRAIVILVAVFMFSACGKSRSVEGTYAVYSKSVEGVTVTLGKGTFAFSSGASGTYEVSGDNVIFSGMTFAGTMKIEKDNLANEKWRFTKIE